MDILIIFQDIKNSTNTILEFNQILSNYGIVIEVDGLYYLNDYGEQEFDPEDITNPQETLNRIANWPTAGWLEYSVTGYSMLVSFKTLGDFCLSGIYLSMYESEYNYQKETLDRVIYYLHEHYKPLRTIKGENIFENFCPEDEITSVRNGIFEGDYEIDLRYYGNGWNYRFCN